MGSRMASGFRAKQSHQTQEGVTVLSFREFLPGLAMLFFILSLPPSSESHPVITMDIFQPSTTRLTHPPVIRQYLVYSERCGVALPQGFVVARAHRDYSPLLN